MNREVNFTERSQLKKTTLMEHPLRKISEFIPNITHYQERFLFNFKRAARFENLVSLYLTINGRTCTHCKDTKYKNFKGYISFSHFSKFYTKKVIIEVFQLSLIPLELI